MTRAARMVLLTVMGVTLCAASVAGLGLLADWPPLTDAMAAVAGDVRPRGGVWRLLRGSMRYLAIPSLLLLGAIALGVVWHRSRMSAMAFGVCVLLSNAVVQAVKHGLLPSPDGLNPLSGHAGLASGLALGWFAFAENGGEGRGSCDGRGLVLPLAAGTGGAVVLTGWHSLPQVLCPLGLAAGCTLVGRAAMEYWAAKATGSHARPFTARVIARAPLGGTALAVLLIATGVGTFWALPLFSDRPVVAAVVCVAVVVTATGGAMALLQVVRAAFDPLVPSRVRGN